MQQDKILSLIGLAKRADKLSHGQPLCEKDIKQKKSELIIISEDISEKSKKAITDCCTYYSTEYIEYASMSELGKACGAKGDRTVVSINDKGFKNAVLKKYADLKTGRNGD